MRATAVSASAMVGVFFAVLAVSADAGRIGSFARGGALDAQLGVRFETAMPEVVKTGQAFTATVIDPGKLGALGVSNLKRGDKVSLVAGSDGKFQVASRGGKSRPLQLNKQGKVGLAQ